MGSSPRHTQVLVGLASSVLIRVEVALLSDLLNHAAS